MTKFHRRDRVERAEKAILACIGLFARRLRLPRYGERGRCANFCGRCFLAVGVCAFVLFACPATICAQNAQPEILIDSKTFPKGWTHKSQVKGSKLEKTWTISKVNPAIPVLICSGKPGGYLRTVKNYENYELTLEWMYPGDPNCNSGILIHANGTDKIWPISIQVQLHRPEAGSIFPQKGAKTTNRVILKDQKLALKKWHTCKILSKNGTIAVWINGKKVGEVNGCVPSKGHIALQSEGSEIHFRRIRVTEIKPPAKKKVKKPQSKPKKKDGKKPKEKKKDSSIRNQLECNSSQFSHRETTLYAGDAVRPAEFRCFPMKFAEETTGVSSQSRRKWGWKRRGEMLSLEPGGRIGKSVPSVMQLRFACRRD